MNSSYKLKIRQLGGSREESSIRRIRTDHLDASKRLGKQPLADNKKVLNNNQTSNAIKPTKKVTAIKSNLGKSTTNYSRLTTEPYERPQYLHHHRTNTAVEKPTNTTIANQKKTISSSFKKK